MFSLVPCHLCSTLCWLWCIQFWTTKACCLLNCWLLYLFLWRLVASATTVLLENNIIEGVGSGWQFYLLCQYLKLQGTHSIFHYYESVSQSFNRILTGVWESCYIQTWKTYQGWSKRSWCFLHNSMCWLIREDWYEKYDIWDSTTRGNNMLYITLLDLIFVVSFCDFVQFW